MLTTSQLQQFEPDAYTGVIVRWGQAADAISSASSTISGIGEQMSRWTGPAADQALTTMGDLVTVVADSPGLLSDAQDTLAAFVAAVSQEREVLQTALVKARSLHCSVAEDGTVTPPLQPPGAPTPASGGDPVQDATQRAAQTAYDNSPAVQAWLNATQQAPGLQATIQEALQRAAAADHRAASDLEAGIRGGADVRRIVAGQDVTGGSAEDLFQDTEALGDGTAWVEQYAKEAASLLPRAARGDAGAASQLALLTSLSYDQDFGANLMARLGAAGLEKIPATMGQELSTLLDGDPEAAGVIRQADQSVLRFLADSLASASQNPNLDPAFVQALTGNATVANPDGLGPPIGFWSLGQILGAATGVVTYAPSFLDTVGTAIINQDRQQQAGAPVPGWEDNGPFQNPWANNLNLSSSFDFWQANEPSFFGVTDSGGDPVYGLMHAAGVSPQAGLALLSSNNYANLNYLMARTWTFDHGSALGQAIASAGDQPGPAAAALSAHAVRDYLPHLGQMQEVNGQSTFVTTSYNGGSLSGINAGLGQVLGYHMSQVFDAWDGIPDSQAAFPTIPQGLGSLLAAVGSDPAGYRALIAGAVANAKLDLQGKALQLANDPLSVSERIDDFNGIAQDQGHFVGYLLGTHTAALTASGLAQDQIQAEQASQEAAIGNFVSQGIGLIPLPGSDLVGSAFKTVLGDVVTGATSHAASDPNYQAALASGGQAWTATQNLMGQVVSSTMVNAGLYDPGTSPATWLHDSPGEVPFFTTTRLPDGQTGYDLIPRMTQAQYTSFVHWLQGEGDVGQGGEGSVGDAMSLMANAVDHGTQLASSTLAGSSYPDNP